jgi:class 3 adenylate cyclase
MRRCTIFSSTLFSLAVLFADIAGFTAWASQRDPIQVFTLLETLYGAFDAIAEKRGVFKVETIGDCYVAVVGLPKPRKQHAVIMARFADDCLQVWRTPLPVVARLI